VIGFFYNIILTNGGCGVKVVFQQALANRNGSQRWDRSGLTNRTPGWYRLRFFVFINVSFRSLAQRLQAAACKALRLETCAPDVGLTLIAWYKYKTPSPPDGWIGRVGVFVVSVLRWPELGTLGLCPRPCSGRCPENLQGE
jgi:hypothetical protein